MNVSGVVHETGQSAITSSTANGDSSSMFMQLLLAQLQNQDPMSPMDGNQLASQMVQLNLLEEVTQIQQAVTQLTTKPSGQ